MENTTKIPFWKELGAETEEEWCAYSDYCAEENQKKYADFVEKHPDEDPQDFIEEITADVMTIEEWRKANK